MPRFFLDFAPALLAAVLAGVLVAALDPTAVGLLVAVLALAVLGLLARFRGGWASGQRYPVATVLVGIFVLLVAWSGVRGIAALPVADLPLLAALPLVALAALRRTQVLPVPGWLLWVAGGLAVAALLPALFVPDPPPRVLGPQSALTLGVASSRASDLALWGRMEYALVVVPVLIGAVSRSWIRARVIADLWLASAAICGVVACLDSLANTGIADALVTDKVVLGGRAVGLTTHANYLGLFMAMALPLGITRVFQTSGIPRFVAIGATVVLALAIQLSGSRLALVAAVVGVSFLLVLVPRFRTRILLAFLACVGAAVVLVIAVPSNYSAFDRLSGHDPSVGKSTDERLRVIDEALDNGLDHPLTGIGFGRILDSHSMPAQFLQAGGIVALATLVLWAFGIGRLGRRLSRDPSIPPPSAQLAAAMASGLAAWLITGIISPQVAERFMYVPAGILLGLGLAAAQTKSGRAARQISGGHREPQTGSSGDLQPVATRPDVLTSPLAS
jgi:O-Antigen ligase